MNDHNEYFELWLDSFCIAMGITMILGLFVIAIFTMHSDIKINKLSLVPYYLGILVNVIGLVFPIMESIVRKDINDSEFLKQANFLLL